GRGREGALSPLREPPPDGPAPRAARERLPLGPRGPGVPRRRAMRMNDAAPDDAPLRVRAATRDDARRWDDFVAGARDATFFHRAGWRDVLEGVFRHRCHYLVAERGASVAGVLPLAEVRSRLFGHSLASLPFC